MKLRAAVCLNLSLKISESLTAFLRIGSRSRVLSMSGIWSTSTLWVVPIMKSSSVMVTETLAPVRAVMRYAYPLERASFTLLPNG